MRINEPQAIKKITKAVINQIKFSMKAGHVRTFNLTKLNFVKTQNI